MENEKKSLIGAIPLIGGIASSIASGISSRKAQKRQMNWDKEFWNMQNQYNSPQEQMKRLQAAGLNPNLVYGQSSGGAAGQAERIKTPDLSPEAHRQIDAQGAFKTLGEYVDTEVKQAQTDNLKAATQVAQENAILTAQKSYGEGVRNARTLFDLNMAEELRDTSLDLARQQLRKMKADTTFTMNQDERATIATVNSTAEAVERILSARTGRKLTEAQTANIRADNELKMLDKKLAAMGVRPSDPFYFSAIARFLKKYSEIRESQ